MIFTGNTTWFVQPTSRYALNTVSPKHITKSNFTFMCKIKVDWEKMIEYTSTQEGGVMIKNGKHLGISVAKTGNDFRIIKGELWTKSNNSDGAEINQIIIPVNDVANTPDISEDDLNITFSCDIIGKKITLTVNNITKTTNLKGEIIDYSASWLWVGCCNALDSFPEETKYFFYGELSYAAIFAKALTARDIREVQHTPSSISKRLTPTCAFDFKRQTPYKVLDIAGTGNHLIKFDKEWMDES